MIKTLNLNVFGTKSDIAPLKKDLIDSHLLATTTMSLLLLSIPGQLQDLLLWMFLEIFFVSIWVFFYNHSRITGLQGKGEGISLTPHYHFHQLTRHLNISRAITADSSPLHKRNSRTRTGNLWFPSASR